MESKFFTMNEHSEQRYGITLSYHFPLVCILIFALGFTLNILPLSEIITAHLTYSRKSHKKMEELVIKVTKENT